MKLRIIFVVSILFIAVYVHSQKVINVTSVQEGQRIRVSYEIPQARFYQKFDVLLYVSFDGGKSYMGPLKGVSGDVGLGITKGVHSILWDPFKDVTSLEGDVVFDVRAWVLEDDLDKKFFVSYNAGAILPSGDYNTPFGVQFGQFGKVGWYISARFNTTFTMQSDLIYDNELGQIQNYQEETLYYEFDNEAKHPRFSVTGGVIYQINWKSHLYAGLGYGQKTLLWHINEYSYENNEQISDNYVKNNQYSASGIEVETGVMFELDPVVINIGVSTLNAKYYSLIVGMGIGF